MTQGALWKAEPKWYAYLSVGVETISPRGACYKPANWVHAGHTQGRAKLNRYKRYHKSVKEIFLYPLTKNFTRILAGDPDGLTE